MTLPRINPMTTGVLTVTVLDDAGAPVPDATVTADIYGPNGGIIENDLPLTHFSGGIYTADIDAAWSAASGDNGPVAIEGRYRAYITITTPDDLRETDRVSWIAAYPSDD